jgi:hypothetical protein
MKFKEKQDERGNLPTEYSTSSGEEGGDGVCLFFRLPIMIVTVLRSRRRGGGGRSGLPLFTVPLPTTDNMTTAKSKSKSKQQEALQFLDDLDSLPEAPLPNQTVKGGKQQEETGDASEVLAFIDQITQKSSEPTRTTSAILERPRSATPTVRKPTERVKLSGSSTSAPGSISRAPSQTHTPPPPVQQEEQPPPGGGNWGFGGWSNSVWSSASAALQQARSVVDEQVKHLPNNDQAKRWREGVLEYAKNADLEKITTLGAFPPPQSDPERTLMVKTPGQNIQRVGLSTLNEILNVVAPPISEHEVIQIWLSHDMQGYDGVESVVYKAFAKVRMCLGFLSGVVLRGS